MSTSPKPTEEDRLRLHRAVQLLIDDLARSGGGQNSWTGNALRALLASTRYVRAADGTEIAEMPAASLVALTTMINSLEESMRARDNHVRLLEAKVALLVDELRTKDEQLEALWEESRRKPSARETTMVDERSMTIVRDPHHNLGMLRWMGTVLEEVFCGKFGCFSCFDASTAAQGGSTSPADRPAKLSELLPPRPNVSAEDEGEQQITDRNAHVEGDTPRTVVASPRGDRFTSPRYHTPRLDDQSDPCACPTMGGAKIVAVLPSSPSATLRFSTSLQMSALPQATVSPAKLAYNAQPKLLPPGSVDQLVCDVETLSRIHRTSSHGSHH